MTTGMLVSGVEQLDGDQLGSPRKYDRRGGYAQRATDGRGSCGNTEYEAKGHTARRTDSSRGHHRQSPLASCRLPDPCASRSRAHLTEQSICSIHCATQNSAASRVQTQTNPERTYSPRMSTPDLLAGFDEIRARRLRNMKRNAAGLLVLAALIFIATFIFTEGDGWAGYVRAAAEAAMVGGIADWFAVTALFRHPLGIPIPHTALIPRGKDAIGRGLGEFVQRNFMNPDSLVERVREANLSLRLGQWLAQPTNAESAARQAAGVIAAVAETVNEDEVQDSIREMVSARIEAIDAAPLVGNLLDRAVPEAITSCGYRRATRRRKGDRRKP